VNFHGVGATRRTVFFPNARRVSMLVEAAVVKRARDLIRRHDKSASRLAALRRGEIAKAGSHRLKCKVKRLQPARGSGRNDVTGTERRFTIDRPTATLVTRRTIDSDPFQSSRRRVRHDVASMRIHDRRQIASSGGGKEKRDERLEGATLGDQSARCAGRCD